MTTKLALRDYQEGALAAVAKQWGEGVRRPAVVLPTGAGKTVVFAHQAERFVEANPGKRVVILAHTDELVTQAARKLHMVAPHLRVGIVKAARNDVTADVVVASVQSLRSKKRRAQLRNVGLVIVDECHHAIAATYMAILEDAGCFGDGALALGVTATLARGDNAKLSKVWEDVAYRRDILFMIKRKYLLDVRGKRVEVPDLDLAGVKKSGGDYQAEDLGEHMEASLAPEIVAKAYVEHAADRAGILFAPTVSSAYVFEAELRKQGIAAETIHGALPMLERRQIIKRLESGETQVVCNCMVLTEGFDSPIVSAVVVARPTRSAPLYQQMVGRALRPYGGLEGSEDMPAWVRQAQTQALVLDVVGASRTHSLASLVDLSEEIPDLKDDQSLLESLEDELDEGEALPTPKLIHRGPVEVKDFDPLARASKRVWLTTRGGVRFIGAGDEAYVFLIDSLDPDAPAGAYDVAWCTKDRYDRRGGLTEYRAIELGYAMSWAEEQAVELGGPLTETYSRKDRAWRKGAPSDKAMYTARRLGWNKPTTDAFSEPVTAGEISTFIDTAYATARIDPIVAAFNQQRSATQ